MDGEISPLGGEPDTPPNTPVTPSHKTSRERREQWKETEEPGLTASVGQHHRQRHHHHHNHDHNHHHYHHYQNQNQNQNHHQHPSNSEKKSSSISQGACEARTPNDSSSIYSCYHTHWCAASNPPSPSPSPSLGSPSPCFSSEDEKCEESDPEQTGHHGNVKKIRHTSTNQQSDDNDDQEHDCSSDLPSPGTRPITNPSPTSSILLTTQTHHPNMFHLHTKRWSASKFSTTPPHIHALTRRACPVRSAIFRCFHSVQKR